MGRLRLTVSEYSGVGGGRSVCGGVPLPEGGAPDGTDFALLDEGGQPLPVQTQILGRWKDGSARWVLLDFMSAPEPGTTAAFSLQYGAGLADQTDMAVPCVPVATTPPTGIDVEAVGHVELLAVSETGDVLPCVFASCTAETSGPVRSTCLCTGTVAKADGTHLLSVRLRISHYPGTGAVRLEPLIIVDSAAGVMQRLRELRVDITYPAVERAVIGGTAWEGGLAEPVRLLQVDDEMWRVEGSSADEEGGRAPGWMELHGPEGVTAVAVRDFREQWPKSLGVREGAVSIGLLPAFAPGEFDHMEPWFKYQYLFEEDCYRFRTGQARRWEIWVQPGIAGADLCKSVNAPLVPAPDPAAAIATGVWGAIAPAGVAAMSDYDPWVERLFESYCGSIAGDRDYGAMNWGDWFGERRINWGNHEYDTTRQLLIQFARTGDPRYFRVADAAARHSSEVDVVHAVNQDLAAYFTSNWGGEGYPPRPGMVHEHCVGHVGAFYPIDTVRKLLVEHGIGHNDHPYLCLDPFNLGHVWTQGLARHYFLTGDPFVRETVEQIGGNLAQLVEDGVYAFGIEDPHFGRAAGWPLLAMAGAYELEFDERYLNAMRELVDRALGRQDPCCGGWLYQLYPGHCLCTTRQHVGMAGFITSVLVNGLSEYGHLTGDERIPDAVERAITYLIDDTWVEQRSGFRYTSCPASSFHGQAGVTVMALVNAVRLANNPEHLRVLAEAWDAKFAKLRDGLDGGPGQGKAFTSTLYGCAEAVGLLSAWDATPGS